MVRSHCAEMGWQKVKKVEKAKRVYMQVNAFVFWCDSYQFCSTFLVFLVCGTCIESLHTGSGIIHQSVPIA